MWLAASADRRVSVWSADWTKDYCQLVDWLTFPAPAFTPGGDSIRPGDKVGYKAWLVYSFEQTDSAENLYMVLYL